MRRSGTRAASWDPRISGAPQLHAVRQDAGAGAGFRVQLRSRPVVHRPGRVQPHEVVREGGHHLHRVARRRRRLGAPSGSIAAGHRLDRRRPRRRRRRRLCPPRAAPVHGGRRGRRGLCGGDRRRVRLRGLPLREGPRALLGGGGGGGFRLRPSPSRVAQPPPPSSSRGALRRASLRRRLASRSRPSPGVLVLLHESSRCRRSPRAVVVRRAA